MPASLSEAFRSPNNDNSSSYTRSSLESLKNPQFSTPYTYNTLMPVQSSQPSTIVSADRAFVSQSSLNNRPGTYLGHNQYQYQSGGCGLISKPGNQVQVADTASLISSINSDQFNDEVEQIKRKYNIEDDDVKKSSEQTCDMNIYHILSCSKCRKRLKRLLRDDEEKEEDGEAHEFCDHVRSQSDSRRESVRKRRKRKIVDDDYEDEDDQEMRGGAIDLNRLFRGQTSNIFLYVILGIFIILFLDFLMRCRFRG